MEEVLTTAPQPACRFCQIIHRDIKSAIVFEDETSLAFLRYAPALSRALPARPQSPC